MNSKLTLILLFLCSISAFAQTFTVFADPDGDNSLQAIALDEWNDRIWVGTNATVSGETIAFLEGGQWTRLNINELDLLTGRLEDLIVNDGIIEACSFGGVSRIDWENQVFETWTSSNSDLTVDPVRCLAKDVANDILYLGTSNGFNMQTFDGVNWADLEDIRLAKTAEFDAANNRLWVGTSAKGLFKVENGIITNYKWSNSDIPSGAIFDLEIDPNGKVWMVIDDEGLIAFDGENWEQYTTENSNIITNSAFLITLDPEGRIWISHSQGITSYDGINFTNYLVGESEIPTANIRQMKTASNGDLWMATNQGLVRLSFEPTNAKEIVLLDANIYPNPVSEQLTIQLEKEIEWLEILNANGQTIWQCSEVRHSIEVDFLKPGIYFLQIHQEDGKKGIKKFIKK